MTTIHFNTPGYFMISDVEKLPTEPTLTATVKIIAYHNGMWWCVPDPRETSRCEQAEIHYNMGMFTTRKVFYAEPNQLPDPDKFSISFQ